VPRRAKKSITPVSDCSSVFAQTTSLAFDNIPILKSKNPEDNDMRAQITLPTVLIGLLASMISAAAQTGEFASPVTGRVMHDSWELQDRLQNARSGMATQPVNRHPRTHYYGDSNLGKPVAGSTTTVRNGTKSQE
jgi:hypothetical protein